jgi:hypothetical protein
LLGVGLKRLRELVRTGIVPACRLGKRWWRVDLEVAREAILRIQGGSDVATAPVSTSA